MCRPVSSWVGDHQRIPAVDCFGFCSFLFWSVLQRLLQDEKKLQVDEALREMMNGIRTLTETMEHCKKDIQLLTVKVEVVLSLGFPPMACFGHAEGNVMDGINSSSLFPQVGE